MKKIVTGIVALALASSVFAADFAAKVKMDTVVAAGKGNTTEILKLNSVDQKDADALVVSVGGDQSGANFQFWYKYTGSGSDALVVRSANVWFKPIEQIKVTVGDVSIGTYKEQIYWWKDPAGASLAAFNSWGCKYSSYSSVEGAGAAIETTPIAGLTINAGIAMGADKSLVTLVKGADPVIGAYGADVKYDFNGLVGIPLTAAVSWRDAGTGAEKVLSVGADFGAAFADGFYGFLNARMRFEAGELAGITFDNYCKFSMGGWKVAAKAPVTIRMNDDSFMSFAVKGTYAIGAFVPYIEIGNDVNNGNGISFASFGDTFNMAIKPGVTFNVGSCAIDAAFQAEIPAKGGDFAWSIPVVLGVAF